MQKGLVSIVSPCYNREHILHRFLDSVLAQTYRKIQVILVDDGSTDDTRGAAMCYEDRFQEAGMDFEYYCQENGGVSSAINTGLKYVRGEFLCWPDSDDWYAPESIEKRVQMLNKHPEYGIVSSDADFYYEDDLTTPQGMVSGKSKVRFEENQFELLLHGNSLVCNICHMVRTEAFFETHPGGKIYNSRHGQNIQMLLPVYYRYKRGFIDEPLCHYLIIRNSLSHSDDTFGKKLAYRNAIEDLMTETLCRIEMPQQEREKYIRYTRIKNTRRKLVLAGEYKKKVFAKEQIDYLRSIKALSLKDVFSYIKI